MFPADPSDRSMDIPMDNGEVSERRERKQHEAKGYCITRKFIICKFRPKRQDDEMGGACSTHWRDEKST
jgi:hypothetical protein